MNPEEYQNLVSKLYELSDQVQANTMQLESLKDSQSHYMPIPDALIIPAIGIKVVYDEFGRIRDQLPLESSDLPMIPMEQIDGMHAYITKEMESKSEMLQSIESLQMHVHGSKNFQTGTKVNVDENGHVISVSELLPEDIPSLPMEKILGLQEWLQSIQPMLQVSEPVSDPKPVPEVSQKTSDAVWKLEVKLHELENTLSKYVLHGTVDRIQKTLDQKLDDTHRITPGTYSKVAVDAHGLITSGGSLELKDLPHLEISSIEGLRNALLQKVDRNAFNDLQNQVSLLVESQESVNACKHLESQVLQKADASEVREIKNQLQFMIGKLNGCMEMVSGGKLFDAQFREFSRTLSSLESRIVALESHHHT